MFSSEQLKKYRLENNLTQEEVAERLGVHKNTYYNYENGGNIPKSKYASIENLLHNKKINYLEEERPVYGVQENEEEESKVDRVKIRIMKVLIDMLDSGDLSNEMYLKLSKELLK